MNAAAVKPTRQSKRRERTRAKLIEAAKKLFSEQGMDATSIADIAETADVGFGSFYNHFDSKDQIAEAAIDDVLAGLGPAIVGATADLEDPAERVSAAHRFLIAKSRREPSWGWLLLRLDLAYPAATRALAEYARGDIRAGVESGRFDIPDEEAAFAVTGGALFGVMRSVLLGEVGDDAGERLGESVLRVLGLDPDDAREVAKRPLPEGLRIEGESDE